MSGSDAAEKPFWYILPPLTVIFLRYFTAIRTLISPIMLAVHLSFSLFPLVLRNYYDGLPSFPAPLVAMVTWPFILRDYNLS